MSAHPLQSEIDRAERARFRPTSEISYGGTGGISDDLMAELMAIGAPEAEAEAEPEAAPEPVPAPAKPAPVAKLALTYGVEDDEGRIWDAPKLTRYDKARAKLVAVLDKLAQEKASEVPDLGRIHMLKDQVERAQQGVKRALTRDNDPIARKQDAIDRWRADAGREEYNGGRRKARANPNADLSDMTEGQKADRLRQQKADSAWRKRCAVKGLTPEQIEAAFAERLAKRAPAPVTMPAPFSGSWG